MAVALHGVTFAGFAVLVEGDKGAVGIAGEEAATANSDIVLTFCASIGLGEIEGNGGAECFGRKRSAGSGNLDGKRERLGKLAFAILEGRSASFADLFVVIVAIAVATTVAASAILLELATHPTAHAFFLTTDLACVAGWVG
jgi:hypothetical protein